MLLHPLASTLSCAFAWVAFCVFQVITQVWACVWSLVSRFRSRLHLYQLKTQLYRDSSGDRTCNGLHAAASDRYMPLMYGCNLFRHALHLQAHVLHHMRYLLALAPLLDIVAFSGRRSSGLRSSAALRMANFRHMCCLTWC